MQANTRLWEILGFGVIDSILNDYTDCVIIHISEIVIDLRPEKITLIICSDLCAIQSLELCCFNYSISVFKYEGWLAPSFNEKQMVA